MQNIALALYAFSVNTELGDIRFRGGLALYLNFCFHHFSTLMINLKLSSGFRVCRLVKSSESEEMRICDNTVGYTPSLSTLAHFL